MDEKTTATPPLEIRTNRCVLKGFEKQDAGPLYGLLECERERITPHFGILLRTVTKLALSESYVEERQRDWDGGREFHYAIWSQDREDLIGVFQIKSIDWNVPKAELAFFLSESWEGHGLMGEAIRAILNTCFESLQLVKVYLRIDTNNSRSIALARRMGFFEEGVHRKDHRNGVENIIDVAYYRMLSEEYFEKIAEDD